MIYRIRLHQSLRKFFVKMVQSFNKSNGRQHKNYKRNQETFDFVLYQLDK